MNNMRKLKPARKRDGFIDNGTGMYYSIHTNKQRHPTDGKGSLQMKKLISFILVIALAAACGVSLAEGTAQDGKIEFFLPATVAELGLDELPLDDFPAIKTKKVHQITTITVTGELDKLYANWMGYGEVPEEVTLTDGIGQISAEGHKYSVGTRYTTGTYTNYVDMYDYYDEDETFAEAETALIAEHAAEAKDGGYVEDIPMEGFAVVRYHWVYYIKDGVICDIELTTEQVGALYQTYEEANAAGKALMGDGSIWSRYSSEYGAEVYTSEGFWVKRIGGFALMFQRKWNYSNGWPNRAYTVKKGEYSVDYTRGGETNYASRTMEGTDLFRTGIQGATSTVNWEIHHRKSGVKTVVTSVTAVYPEGSPISSISVSYQYGKVYRYTVKHNAGDGKSYTATYSSKDRLVGANYLAGDVIVAKHSRGDTWVNLETKLYEHGLESANGPLFSSAVRVTE